MLEQLKNRRACRAFSSKPVEKEKVDEIIAAGLAAPSGMNGQSSVIIAIEDRETRDALMRCNASFLKGRENMDTFYGAPVVLMVIAKKGNFPYHDGAATIENMLVEATNQGLCSCWIHRAEETIQSEEGRRILSFTGLNFDEYVGVGNVIVGYPEGEFKPAEKIIKPGRLFRK